MESGGREPAGGKSVGRRGQEGEGGMKYLSLFSGIGGFEKGIEQAYGNLRLQRVEERRENETPKTFGRDCQSVESIGVGNFDTDVECVGYSEIDKPAIAIYRKHCPEHKNYGDITRIIPEQLSDFDLLVGGFPCQAFSIAGKRGGFRDVRGTLFFEIARILEAKKPKHFLLENVKGLFSHDSGRTFKTIITALNDLGYCVEWDCLNSKFYGVPQNRERVFVVGYFGGIPEQEIFPLGESSPTTSNANEIAYCLDANYQKGGNQGNKCSGTFISELKQVGNIDTKGHNSLWGRVYSTDGVSSTLNSRGGGMGAKTGLYQVNESKESGGKQPFQQNRIYDEKGLTPAHQAEITSGSYAVQTQSRIRRLTPTECARLQGFPDSWCDIGIDEKGNEIKMSDSVKYRVLGNAVTVNVIEAIITKMLEIGRFENNAKTQFTG